MKVLLDLGQAAIDCVVVELDEQREKALNIAFNKIQGEWDENKQGWSCPPRILRLGGQALGGIYGKESGYLVMMEDMLY